MGRIVTTVNINNLTSEGKTKKLMFLLILVQVLNTPDGMEEGAWRI